MNRDDIAILKSIQKNTEMSMKAIDVIESKVYDQELALLLAKNAQKYSDIHRESIHSLVESKVQPYKCNVIENMMLVGGINTNTLLNTSTSHIAELMIKTSNMGITDMTRILNHHKCGEKETVNIAQELLETEKNNVEEYKKYL